MGRNLLGVAAGFIVWIIAWFGGEQILSAIWPEAIGVPQRAFQAAVENGGPFMADTALLLVHCALVSIVSILSGALTASITGEGNRAPMILGGLLLVLGLAKAAMSWSFVPLWYHIAFTALLVLMAMIGGRLRTTTK